VAPDLVLVGRRDLVRQVLEEHDTGEPQQGEQLVAGGDAAGRLLVGLAEVGLERVDRLQPDRDAPGVDVGPRPRRPGQRLDQRRVVGPELDRVAVGLGALPGQVRVPDHERAAQQHVAHDVRGPR